MKLNVPFETFMRIIYMEGMEGLRRIDDINLNKKEIQYN